MKTVEIEKEEYEEFDQDNVKEFKVLSNILKREMLPLKEKDRAFIFKYTDIIELIQIRLDFEKTILKESLNELEKSKKSGDKYDIEYALNDVEYIKKPIKLMEDVLKILNELKKHD